MCLFCVCGYTAGTFCVLRCSSRVLLLLWNGVVVCLRCVNPGCGC